jgi:putative nucleotidyltransferase with HDIG domain
MTSEEYFDVLSRVKNFPTVPEIYRRLETALEDPETDIHTVSGLIMQDPVLSAKLIRIANSSFFAFRDRVTSVQKAVSHLGLNLVKNLTLSTSVLASFTGTRKNTDRTDFWRHSVGVGIASRMIGRDYGLSLDQSEELYTIGLLHDIGKVITEQYFPEQYDRILNLLDNPPQPFWKAEQTVIGLTHAETGSWVVRNWNFDHRIVCVIQYHHAIDAGFEFVTERERLFLSIISFADWMMKELNYGSTASRCIESLHPKVIGFLELTPVRTDGYKSALKKQLDHVDDFISSHF